jgi:glyoxylase-like metal-dependent hydrolase (beta-lactamase superfamily II)
MRVYHLNCGSMFPYFPRVQAIVYCLLVETNDGLLLVDTGFGTKDYAKPTRLMRLFTRSLRTPCDVEETAARQVVELGYEVEDVKHIVLTHLHLDHAGGLPDFPDAEVHTFRPEYEAAMHPRGLIGHAYISAHWAHGPKWVVHELEGDKWFGFDCVRVKEGLQPEVLLLPLIGHTRGHCGVAVKTSEGWLLHCGDAASPFHPQADPYHPFEGMSNWLVRYLIGTHVPRLRDLVREHGDEIKLISGHDVYSFRKYHDEH